MQRIDVPDSLRRDYATQVQAFASEQEVFSPGDFPFSILDLQEVLPADTRRRERIRIELARMACVGVAGHRGREVLYAKTYDPREETEITDDAPCSNCYCADHGCSIFVAALTTNDIER